MLEAVICKTCKTLKHLDHYKCSLCDESFGLYFNNWKFCPNCGAEFILTKREACEQQGIDPRSGNVILKGEPNGKNS